MPRSGGLIVAALPVPFSFSRVGRSFLYIVLMDEISICRIIPESFCLVCAFRRKHNRVQYPCCLNHTPLCQIVSITHMMLRSLIRRGILSNRYNSFNEKNCDAQFDDNSCKRHRPKDPDCTDKAHCFCCTNCPVGPVLYDWVLIPSI